MNEAFIRDFEQIKNLKEFFAVCEKHYDCENAKIGTIVRNQLKAQIPKIIAITGAKQKK